MHPAFAPAVSYFSRLFDHTSRGGGALSVRMNGVPVVDVWAGFADRSSRRPWTRDTVTICFSTTKGVAATVIHRLADRGLIDYHEPVASYWPEFGSSGKDRITVGQLLSHQAGLHSLAGLVDTPSDLLDHRAMEEKLASRAPDAMAGHPGYHAFTYGWLLAGLARSVTGSGMAELVRSELAQPLGTDGLGIGMPPDGLIRFARPVSSSPPIRPTPPLAAAIGATSVKLLSRLEPTRRFAEALNAPQLHDILEGPSPSILRTEMPSVNGMLSAHGLAKLYSALACDGEVGGVRLLSKSTTGKIAEIQTSARDAVLGVKMLWRLGYHRAGVQGYRDTGIFGHFGFGGSGGWAEPSSGLSLGFVTNELRLLQAPVGGDYRIFRLGGLVRRAAALMPR